VGNWGGAAIAEETRRTARWKRGKQGKKMDVGNARGNKKRGNDVSGPGQCRKKTELDPGGGLYIALLL